MGLRLCPNFQIAFSAFSCYTIREGKAIPIFAERITERKQKGGMYVSYTDPVI